MTSATTSPSTSTTDDNDEQHDRRPTVGAEEIDRLNLERALLDFEIANARVVDLTARLTTLHQQLVTLQHDLSMARLETGRVSAMTNDLVASRDYAEYERNVARAELHAVKTSRSYRAARVMAKALRRVVG